MAAYIALVNFTDQGIRNVKRTTQRARALTTAAAKLRIKVKQLYWTLGAYDAVFIAEAPSDEAMTVLALSVGSLGNIRTQTMRAYSAAEMDKILARLP